MFSFIVLLSLLTFQATALKTVDSFCVNSLVRSYRICKAEYLNRIQSKGIGNRLDSKIFDPQVISCCSKKSFLSCIESNTDDQCKADIIDWVRSQNFDEVDQLFRDCNYCVYSVSCSDCASSFLTRSFLRISNVTWPKTVESSLEHFVFFYRYSVLYACSFAVSFARLFACRRNP